LRIILFAVILLFSSAAFCQIPETKISIKAEDRILTEVLLELEERYDLFFHFDTRWASSVTLLRDYENVTVRQMLNDSFMESTLSVLQSGNSVIILNHDVNPTGRFQFDDRVRLGKVDPNKDIPTARISGRILDTRSNSPLIGATLLFNDESRGVSAGTDGNYSIEVPYGLFSINVSFVGYETFQLPVFVMGDTQFDIYLSESAFVLESVMVSSEVADENVSEVNVGATKLKMKSIKEMPSFMGEADVIKSLLMLPGISSAGEATQGFNVRGGTVDQNLTLMDDIIIFNPSHLFGFFSVYNPDLVREVQIYKGVVPPKFGGRISSVLDVGMDNASKYKMEVEGGIGIASSRLSVGTPIVKGKSSLNLGVRASYADWLLKSTNNPQLESSTSSFYDFTGRYNHSINENNSITLTGYHSYDGFSLASDTVFQWTNTGGAARWDFSKDRFFGSVSGVLYAYNNDVVDDRPIGFELRNSVKYYQAKTDMGYELNDQHKFTFGFGITRYTIDPGALTPGADSGLESDKIQNENAWEPYMYINDEFKLSPKLTLTGGVRFSGWRNIGPKDVYLYDPSTAKSPESIVDTVSYAAGDEIASYGGIEPRLGFNYRVSPSTSIKGGYNRSYQYLHLLSNTTSVTPTDQWQASNFHFKPQIGDQYSLGIFKNLKENIFELSLEGYYKTINNILDYKEGSEIFLNKTVEADVITGKGKAYGAELLLNKTRGRFTGWIGYTYSRSLRQMNGQFPEEVINQGEYYPSNFDKPHDFSTYFTYKIQTNIALSLNFVYSTGRPITIPTSKFSYESLLSVIQFSERNQFRIPDYHRLDLSLTIDNVRNREKYQGSVVFTIYNMYARRNAYSIVFDQTGFARRISILGTIFPSVTYNFKFL